jgi:hypothetical protein
LATCAQITGALQASKEKSYKVGVGFFKVGVHSL